MTPTRLIAAAVAAATTAVLAWGPTAVLAGITFNAPRLNQRCDHQPSRRQST